MNGGVRDGGHADLVVGPGEEGGERGGDDPLAQHGQPDRRGHELLLGDEHLKEPVGVRRS